MRVKCLTQEQQRSALRQAQTRTARSVQRTKLRPPRLQGINPFYFRKQS